MKIDSTIKISDNIQSITLSSENKKIEIKWLKNIRSILSKSNIINHLNKSNLWSNWYFSDNWLFETQLIITLNWDIDSKIIVDFNIIWITQNEKRLLDSKFDFNKDPSWKEEFIICPYYSIWDMYKVWKNYKLWDLIFEYSSWSQVRKYQLNNFIDISSNDELFSKYILEFIFDIINVS